METKPIGTHRFNIQGQLQGSEVNRCLIFEVRVPNIWGCSSAGRAPALQAGGHRFDPVHLHQEWADSSAG